MLGTWGPQYRPLLSSSEIDLKNPQTMSPLLRSCTTVLIGGRMILVLLVRDATLTQDGCSRSRSIAARKIAI
jgi:hypothetical protein